MTDNKIIVCIALSMVIILAIYLFSFNIHGENRSENEVMKKPGNTNKSLFNELINYLWNNGLRCYRVRLFVDPEQFDEYGVFTGNNLSYTTKLLKKIKTLYPDAKITIDLHYSDTWADPGKQYIPHRWSSYSFDELLIAVYNYTFHVMKTLINNGIVPDMVQTGNEITCGFLWPYGKLCGVNDTSYQWYRFTALLKQAIRGVTDGVRPFNTSIIIHIHSIDWHTIKWFYTNIEKYNVEYDIIGLSYYPWWSGSITELVDSINKTINYFHKPVLVVETVYPHKRINISSIPYASNDYMYWRLDPSGQAEYIDDLLGNLSRVKGVIGVLWWEPFYNDIYNYWLNGSTGLFDRDWDPLPGLRVFSKYFNVFECLGADISTLGYIAYREE